ncbi:BTAD domain-containing putative transcriptional regulator [Catellatospora citrea]|uniref:AfsR/SARP family transcriptional regulator n=1 Tax=Catellatospora citrea TaxID=53366 RepID=UPI003407F401
MVISDEAAAAVSFRLLGAVEVRVADRLIPLSGRQRALLAVLALNAGRVVPAHRLADAIWGEPLPPSHAARIRVLVSEVRKAFSAAGSGLIVTRPPGYLLDTAPGQLDLQTFVDTLAVARAAAGRGDHEAALARYDEALALWQGSALDGVTGLFLEAEAARLGELRLLALEDRTSVMLTLGRGAELIAELGSLVAEHPLRERPHGQLMLAFYHSGRRGEALGLYRTLRERLAAELGLEPAPDLQKLHHQLLTGDPALDAAPPVPTPPASAMPPARQLPARSGLFVGRDAELAQLEAWSTGPHRLMLVAGAAGAGKTTLAVHWAHQAAARFPDGQLYCDLKGFQPGTPMPPSEALPRLLRALGVAGDDIPADLDEQVARYRSVLAGQRLLLILDDAADVGQIRPLLPGEPGCLTIATSRNRLSGLVAMDGAQRLTLGVLAPADSLELLGRTAGRELVAADSAAAAEMTDLCGHLPLALRIAGARLADYPQRGLRWYLDDLAGDRISGLQIADDPQASVRAAFASSYAALPAPAQRMFRLLAAAPTTAGAAVEAAAAMAAVGTDEAARQLDTLAAAHLLVGLAPGRYGVHDLIREYGAELAAATPSERAGALRRLLDFYHRSVVAATAHVATTGTRLPPRAAEPAVRPVAFAQAAEANEWLRAETDNLTAAVDQAAASGLIEQAWYLADALVPVLRQRVSPPEWLSVVESGMAAARSAGDPLGMAAMRCAMAYRWLLNGDYGRAAEQYRLAGDGYRAVGYRPGEASALSGLAVALNRAGRPSEAARVLSASVLIHRAVGDRAGEAHDLANRGSARRELGDFTGAVRDLDLALPVLREVGNRIGESLALSNLGEVRHQQGRFGEAVALLGRAMAVDRELGAARREAERRYYLGLVHRDAGRLDEAEQELATALDVAVRLGERHLEVLTLCGLATLHVRAGRTGRADECADRAAAIAGDTGDRYTRFLIAVTRAGVYAGRQRYRQAYESAALALELLDGSASPLHTARADYHLAEACCGLGDVSRGRVHAERALAVQRTAGQWTAVVLTLTVLGRLHQHDGDTAAARVRLGEALELADFIGMPERRNIRAASAAVDAGPVTAQKL